MLHDPNTYTEPFKFKPERYNNDDTAMNMTLEPVFGFGRRVCPGRLFGENTLFMIMATTLSTCHISPGLDENGNEVLPSGKYISGPLT